MATTRRKLAQEQDDDGTPVVATVENVAAVPDAAFQVLFPTGITVPVPTGGTTPGGEPAYDRRWVPHGALLPDGVPDDQINNLVALGLVKLTLRQQAPAPLPVPDQPPASDQPSASDQPPGNPD